MKYIILSLCSLLFVSCTLDQNKKQIAQSSAYNHLIELAEKESAHAPQSSLDFWNKKLSADPKNNLYKEKIASIYSKEFRKQGDIKNILKSDSLLKIVEAEYAFSKASIYHNLGANAITQHEFKLAKAYADKALLEGDKKDQSFNLLFDASMELGDYSAARAILNIKEQKTGFDYLIRASKLADHNGDLKTAIALMEQAYGRVQNHPTLSLWAKSNLGDMYGHDGRINDAYNAYLQVLAQQPTHWHSWQGIAWVNYSNDENIPEAKRILEFIDKHNNNPLTKLLLAEIASYENQDELANTYTKDFYEEVSQTPYQNMYAKYLILLEAETFDLAEKALNRAIKERNARATPEVHDLVAWSLLNMGDNQKALEIAQRHVEGKTSEPDVLHHLGMIHKANGNLEKAKAFLQEALEAEYELGPITINSIKQELSSI